MCQRGNGSGHNRQWMTTVPHYHSNKGSYMRWESHHSKKHLSLRVVATILAICLTLPGWSTALAKSNSSAGRLRIDVGALVKLPVPLPCPEALTDDGCLSLAAALTHYSDIPRLIREQEELVNERHTVDLGLTWDLAYKTASVAILSERGFSWWHVIGFSGLAGAAGVLAGLVIGFLAR